MADSENSMTMEQRIMVQDILTRVWMAMNFNVDTEHWEFSRLHDGDTLALSRAKMAKLVDAINKI